MTDPRMRTRFTLAVAPLSPAVAARFAELVREWYAVPP
jgi:hypothetical protein